ncbi:MAG: hypothetical protein ACJA1Z_003957 [Patiriisocius sp.]|jgi:hypothetical protein
MFLTNLKTSKENTTITKTSLLKGFVSPFIINNNTFFNSIIQIKLERK